ncbi:MAG: hypothetical protein H6686_03815 [Fibrobacteria bacterium]|nr:hypothetical protein [Fibrobacteria bacterium]
MSDTARRFLGGIDPLPMAPRGLPGHTVPRESSEGIPSMFLGQQVATKPSARTDLGIQIPSCKMAMFPRLSDW